MTKTLGDRIRELREGVDLSLRDMAKKTGVSAAFLSDIELNRRFPAEDKLELIARALGTTVEDLSQYDSRPPIEEMKRLAAKNPALGIAFRKMVDLPPDEILKRLGGHTGDDDSK